MTGLAVVAVAGAAGMVVFVLGLFVSRRMRLRLGGDEDEEGKGGEDEDDGGGGGGGGKDDDDDDNGECAAEAAAVRSDSLFVVGKYKQGSKVIGGKTRTRSASRRYSLGQTLLVYVYIGRLACVSDERSRRNMRKRGSRNSEIYEREEKSVCSVMLIISARNCRSAKSATIAHRNHRSMGGGRHLDLNLFPFSSYKIAGQ